MVDPYVKAFIVGFSLHAGLLLNAVYQNSFILVRGLSKKPVFGVALVFSVSALLIASIGIYGLHYIVDFNGGAMVKKGIGLIGFVILLYLAFKAYMSAKKYTHYNQTQTGGVFTALSMVWLTPHVYTDMMVISSTAILHPAYLYAAIITGFTSAAFIWFFSLALFSKKLSGLYKTPAIYTALHYLSALILALNSIHILLQTFSHGHVH